jgi:hypothetical protein
MDLLKARNILELPDNYDENLLKKNYRALAMKHHPDKNKENTTEKFAEINAAYEFLSKSKPQNVEHVDNIFNNIFRTFTSFHFPQPKFQKNLKKEVFIKLTPREYFEGSVKSVNIKERCSCEQKVCPCCAGCGFSIPPPTIINFKPLDTCMNCVGEGSIQNCENCENGVVNKNINITIAPVIDKFEIFHPMVGLIKLSIDEPYFMKERMFYRYDISLKESLTGFNKSFKDPFDNVHDIKINGIVKTNDGYQLSGINLVLVFNVVYPDKLSPVVIEQLKNLDF